MRSPWSLLLAEQAQLSQSLHFLGEVLRPSDHLHALLWTRSNSSTSFLCCVQTWTQYCRWGLTGQSRGGQSPPSPPSPCCHPSVDAAQGTVGFLSCKHTVSAQGQLEVTTSSRLPDSQVWGGGWGIGLKHPQGLLVWGRKLVSIRCSKREDLG